MTINRPFNISLAFRRMRKAIAPFPKAALQVLKEEGHDSVFELLVACMISIRTRDEATLPTSQRLFAVARTPEQMAKLGPDEIDALISDCAFHENKAKQIHTIAKRSVEEFGGITPGDGDTLLSFPGVGPKCANLVLGIACGKPHIGVDIHVHRICNRWGNVQTDNEQKTLNALEENLPKRYWIEINALLVPFGKHICTPIGPKCSTCPLADMCGQVGVKKSR